MSFPKNSIPTISPRTVAWDKGSFTITPVGLAVVTFPEFCNPSFHVGIYKADNILMVVPLDVRDEDLVTYYCNYSKQINMNEGLTWFDKVGRFMDGDDGDNDLGVKVMIKPDSSDVYRCTITAKYIKHAYEDRFVVIADITAPLSIECYEMFDIT